MKLSYEIVSQGAYWHLGLYVDGEYAGYAEWQESDANNLIERFDRLVDVDGIDLSNDITYIKTVHVCRKFRGKGLSHKIIKKMLAAIRKRFSNPQIALIVDSSNTMFNNMSLFRLYKKHGFVKYRQTRYMFMYKKKYVKKPVRDLHVRFIGFENNYY